MQFTALAFPIFEKSIEDYHQWDDVDTTIQNPYPEKSIEYYLYLKNWIDTVQWHLEDIIRDPGIDSVKALEIKRRIDKSNQDRTDLVELIDSYFFEKYRNVRPSETATLNTESPSWAIDRLSILALKIFHMRKEVERREDNGSDKELYHNKLNILLEQRKDLSLAIDQLLEDIESGKKYMKVYKQMKMYNDPDLNPVLYGKK
ncbi:MAG: DUF4254 domain-containing protein [Dysgonamonadaceae bacterium]|jgi:hypothetical protein|nr:DUF4254 domain-containing protein [Dysgonamonadaceae bacterium]